MQPFLMIETEPSDAALLKCWDGGMNTADIAKLLGFPEHVVDRRLWRLREARRAAK